MPTGHHPNSRAALRPWPKGVSGNPKGVNQWSKLRQKARKILLENFEQLSEVAIQKALKGDVTMLKFILGPAFDIKALQILDEDGNAQTFADLARAALAKHNISVSADGPSGDGAESAEDSA